MGSVRIDINGTAVEADEGQTILEVVEGRGLDAIPTLCHSPELGPYASCFVCVVEVEGRPGLVPSCATKVADGMVIRTRSPRVHEARKNALELLLSNHYADCVAPCMEGCPAGVDAQGYIALAAMGDYRRAVELIRETNPLPAVCGRICVRKCEVVCRRQLIDEPIAINEVKRFVTDMPGAYAGTPVREPSKGKSVGIVGAGPAGLTAGWFLGLGGYEVVVYENMPAPGGMLRYGIPEYRLPNADLDREIEYITRAGVEIRCGVGIPRDVTVDDLLQTHDAVFLSPGAWGGKAMRVEGEFDTDGVVSGVDYLVEKAADPALVSGTVLVVGGGNTAMDAARTSWRLGADKVIVVYRRTTAEMPADSHEIEDALEEGIEIMELVAPVGIVEDGNRITALTCVRMRLGEPDASGRRRPVPLEGSEFDMPCDLVVSAIGQEPLTEEVLGGASSRPAVSRWSTIEADPATMTTDIDGLFAGGDAANDGPTVVIDAIRDGQRAARAIRVSLEGRESPVEPFVVNKERWAQPGEQELGEVPQSPRHRMEKLPVEEREGNFREVAAGFDHDDVAHEAARCLSCGCVAYDWCELRRYAEEYGVDLQHHEGYARKHKVDTRHPHLVYDPNKCILCAKCIRTCRRVLPVGALGLVNRGFQSEMRPALEEPLVETSCISCGNCVDSCPTGALTVKYPFPGRACLEHEETATHCALCSVGCRLTVKTFGDDRYVIESSGTPGDYLCFYGRFANDLFINRRRLLTPTVREGLTHVEVTYREAYERVVDGLRDAVSAHGPEAVAVFVSPELSNEELYMASRIAREGLGTNNVASLSLLAAGMSSGALDESFGFTASTAGAESLGEADLILCINADVRSDQLIAGIQIQDAVEAGARLVVSDSFDDPLDTVADLKLDPMRGRSTALIKGIMRAQIEEGFFAPERVESMPGGAELLADLDGCTVSAAAAETGVAEERIRRCAEMLRAAGRIVVVHSPDRPRDRAPGAARALADLVLLLRAAGAEADLLLTYQAGNVAGVELSGADPAFVPGRTPARRLPGARDRSELLRALTAGEIKAALVIGEDPMRHDRSAAFFTDLDFLAACDWAATETTLYANVALPMGTYLESEGTRVTYDGRVVESAAAVGAPNGVKTWHVLRNIGDRLGVSIPGVFSTIATELVKQIAEGQGDSTAFTFNTGQSREWDGQGRLVVADAAPSGIPGAPPLTACAQYKSEVQEIGLRDYRVGGRSSQAAP